MSVTIDRAARQAIPASGSVVDRRAVRAAFVPLCVSPLYQSVLEPALAAGFAEAAWSLSLPFTGAVVGFDRGRCVISPLTLSRMTEREAVHARRRAETSVIAEIEHLHEHWTDELWRRANALVRRIEAFELDRYAAVALPMMIDKIIDAMGELTAIRFKLAIPAMTALERFDAFAVHHLKGYEADIATMLTGPLTERIRAESGLADLAVAAKAVGLHKALQAAPAAEAMSALAASPLGDYYLAAVRDYLREFGHRHDGTDLTAPTWRELPAPAMARLQELVASGEDARQAYEAALSAAVQATNVARAVLAEQPGAVRDQFETLLIQARIAAALLDDQELMVDQRARAALRTAFLKLGARLTKLGVLGRADDVFLMTLDELKSAVSAVPSEASIGMLRVRLLEREGVCERPRAELGAVVPEPTAARGGICAVDRAIARLLGGGVV